MAELQTESARSELEARCSLSSPPMQNERVRELQLLLRHNPYGLFDPGRDDGVYDLDTAAATRRAWYWLGCPDLEVSEQADLRLEGLLAGTSELPADWQSARAERLERGGQTLLWDDALAVAREQLGGREQPPGSKRTPATLWYGLLCPYSVVFASYCYAQAGSRAFQPQQRYAFAPYLYDDARRGLNYLSLTSEPLRGDLALFAGMSGEAERVAFFDGWQREHEQQDFDAIEADVGYGGDLEGEGAVARTSRLRAEAIGFVHVRA